MAKSKKERVERSAKTAHGVSRKTQPADPLLEEPAPGPSTESLRRENESLKQRIQQLETERNAYQNAVYAWARKQHRPENFLRVVAEKDHLPLEQFIDQLDQEVES